VPRILNERYDSPDDVAGLLRALSGTHRLSRWERALFGTRDIVVSLGLLALAPVLASSGPHSARDLLLKNIFVLISLGGGLAFLFMLWRNQTMSYLFASDGITFFYPGLRMRWQVSHLSIEEVAVIPNKGGTWQLRVRDREGASAGSISPNRCCFRSKRSRRIATCTNKARSARGADPGIATTERCVFHHRRIMPGREAKQPCPRTQR